MKLLFLTWLITLAARSGKLRQRRTLVMFLLYLLPESFAAALNELH